MKIALTAAAALISVSLAGAATATPSLSYAEPPSDVASAEFVDAKFKLKKYGRHRGFNRGHRNGFGRGHFGKARFGHRSHYKYGNGHFDRGVITKKSRRGSKLFFGKGLFFK